MTYIFVIKLLRLTLNTIQNQSMLINFSQFKTLVATLLFDLFSCSGQHHSLQPAILTVHVVHFVDSKQGEIFTSGIWIVAAVDYKYVLGSGSRFKNHLVFRQYYTSIRLFSVKTILFSSRKKNTPPKIIYTHFIVLQLLL